MIDQMKSMSAPAQDVNDATSAEDRAGPPRPSDPAPGASIDAELLGLAAEFQRTDERLMEINAELAADTTGTMSMDEGEPVAVHDRRWAIVNPIIELPALTVPGWAAKAAMIAPVIRDTSSTDIGTADVNLALSLVRDLTGQAGPGGPDTEL